MREFDESDKEVIKETISLIKYHDKSRDLDSYTREKWTNLERKSGIWKARQNDFGEIKGICRWKEGILRMGQLQISQVIRD